MRYIDLRSDTVTQPTQAMRDAIAAAVVGDDVYRDDPTMRELEQLAADMLGKEAGLFTSSGTMGNQLAIMTHTRRGDEIIASNEAHIFIHEVGAPAVLSGVSVNLLPFPNGMFNAAMIEAAVRSDDIHEPPTSLICIENALSNGKVVSANTMREIYEVAQRYALPVHMDGARIFNAATALNVDVKELTKYTDTVSCCLSKGLCAPVGAVLVGPHAYIERARKNRKLLGGGMRQAGFLAAAGIIALRDMTKRLHEDHDNAKYMAQKLAQIPGVSTDLSAVEINMVFFHVDRPQALLNDVPRLMLEQGIKMNGLMAGEFRFVTSNDVARADIDYAISAFEKILQ